MKRFSIPSVIIILGLFISGCTGERQTIRDDYRPPVFRSGGELALFMNAGIDWVEQTLQRLTVEEKVGQLLVPRAYTHYMSSDSREYRRLIRYVDTLKVGGLVYFRGDVSEMALLANDLQARADIPLLISADFEWGTAMRMRRGTLFPVAMALGATRDPVLAFKKGKAIAREARAVGVHQNFGPVADINTNPQNPVINVRSFGEDTELVKKLAKAYMDGLHEGGVISTAKHFPGHGDTDIDSHLDLPLLMFDIIRLNEIELAPFRYIIDHGLMSIMSAHVAVPVLGEDDRRPATLSHNIMTTLLRNEMGFDGLIVTDALEMRSITRNYTPDEAALMAVEAGADMILLSPDIDLARNSLLEAVRSGRISEERIDRSVRRILLMKYWTGLHEQRFVDVPGYRSIVANEEHRHLAREIARKSMTLVRNENDLLPLRTGEEKSILAVIIADREEQRVAVTRPNATSPTEPAGEYFIRQLQARYENVDAVLLDPRSNRTEFDSLLVKASQADVVVGAAYVRARSSQGEIAIPDEMREALIAVSESATPFVLISFGDPYFIKNVPDVDAYLCAYSSAEASVEAAAETLAGITNPSGRLPVTIPGVAPFGIGLVYPGDVIIEEKEVVGKEEIPGIDVD